MKWFFVRFCLFLCLYGTYTNPHFWTDLNRTMHTSPPSSGGGRRVCTDPQYLTLLDIFVIFCEEPVQNTGQNMAAGPRVIATALYPWCSRRHLLKESSVTALYPWYSRWQLRVLQVPCILHRQRGEENWMHACQYGKNRWDRKELNNGLKLQLRCVAILYIKLKCMVFVRFSFFFDCTSCKATFLNRSDNTWRHIRLHIQLPSSPSSALSPTYFPCRTLHSLTVLSPYRARVCVVPNY